VPTETVCSTHTEVKGDKFMITITTTAEEKIRELMLEEKDTLGLRVYVKGGGCHGYQYGMAFESKMSDDDTVIEKGDVKVIMDSQSAPLLNGCEVDYVDSVQGSGFAIKNPQAKTTCGCGSSFSA
jgi:iron-sulfur cluster insertion protein